MIVVLHGGTADLSKLVQNGYVIPQCVYFDTEVAARWCWPDATDYSLEHLALRLTTISHWRPYGKLDGEDFDSLSDENLAQRCGGDAEATRRLYARLNEEIDRLRMRPIFSLAMDVLPILAEIGGRGLAINDRELASRAYGQDQAGQPLRGSEEWLNTEKRVLQTQLGIENLESDQQLSVALYEKLGAEPLRKNKTGLYSVDHQSLLWARYQARRTGGSELDTLLTRILDYNRLSKLHSTYYKPWTLVGQGLRVRSIYSLGRTATGRLSGFDMNPQNIPGVARELIVPSPGYDYIVSVDYKQLELCVAGDVSQDATLCQWIREGVDIHARQAARVLHLPEPTTKTDYLLFKKKFPLERQVGKRANFATLFLVTAETLAWQIFEDAEGSVWIPPENVQPYINAFFMTFPGWQRHIDRLFVSAQRNEWTVSKTGRRWAIPPTEAGRRKMANYPVQSLASDLVLLVLKRIDYLLKRYRWKTRVIAEVHDSLVFETTTRELHGLCRLVAEECLRPRTQDLHFDFTVPLSIETSIGTQWGKLEPYQA